MPVDTSTAMSAVTLEDAKRHLRVDVKTDDALIEALCLSATQMAEHEMQRAVISRDGQEGLAESPENVPAAVKQWVLLVVGHFYENRQAATTELKALPYIGALLDPYRTWT